VSNVSARQHLQSATRRLLVVPRCRLSTLGPRAVPHDSSGNSKLSGADGSFSPVKHQCPCVCRPYVYVRTPLPSAPRSHFSAPAMTKSTQSHITRHTLRLEGSRLSADWGQDLRTLRGTRSLLLCQTNRRIGQQHKAARARPGPTLWSLNKH